MADLENAVAVVGFAARMPGAPTVDAFWDNLRSGVESITFFSDEDLRAAGVEPQLLAHPRYVKAKPVLEGIELFDAGLFGISPREAEITDPQHRIFLELCHEALERAACTPEQFRGAIGLFAGASLSAYLLHNLAGDRSAGVAQLGIGNVQDFVATRVAYKLNLNGPVYSVQCACSTALVAVHLAVQNLLAGECDVALAGGVSIGLPMRAGYLFQDEGMVSPDGHCRPFDVAARGTVFGSGAGVVVMKRLEDAVNDGDLVHALVIGSAVNNDGAIKAGFTAPSVAGQAAVITEALANAGVGADTIGCVEAHGTATPMGDPIEIEALTRAYRRHTDRRNYCAIGSVKSNIGHLDVAAGIAGFIKTVLSISHGAIPPSLHYTAPNPRIDFGVTPFFVNTTLAGWPLAGVRRAGVSAFGIGGTNAHVILEQPPARRPPGPSRRWHVLSVSARTETALDHLTTDLADHLDDRPELAIADVAFTLHVGRRPLDYRRASLVETTDQAIDRLLDLPPHAVFTGGPRPSARPLVFMFPGQGAQYTGMGASLHADEPALRRELDDIYRRLGRRLDFGTSLDDPGAEQIALFAIEYALARVWMSWGLQPEALIGLSVGECTAAAIAGVLSVDDACRLINERARLMATLPPGAMLAVPLSADDARPLVGGEVSMALLNAPKSCALSGPVDAIAAIEDRLTLRGVVTRRIETRCGYHSPLVDAVLPEIEAYARTLTFHRPRIALLSGVTGRVMTEAEATDPRCWARQIRHPVYFGSAIRELLKDTQRAFLEVGPGQVLAALTRQNADPGASPIVCSSMPDRRERRAESEALMTTLGRLWVAGLDVDWSAFHAGDERHRVALPTYPFERERYWVAPTPAPPAAPLQPQRRPDVADWFSLPTWAERPLARRPRPEPGRWLVFLDRSERSQVLAALIAETSTIVTTVTAGDRYEQSGAHFTLAPDDPQHYERLFAALRTEGRLPEHVLHAWTMGLGELSPDDDSRLDGALSLGFFSLLWLGRAIGGLPLSTRLTVLTPPIHVVVGGERVVPELATALGPLTVIGQEWPGVICRHLEIDGDVADASVDAGRVLAEIHADDGERCVAYRHARRWVRRIEPLPLAPASVSPSRLKPEGVYVITGGAGGIGLTLASFLAREYRARLLLIGRTTPPAPHDSIEALRAHGADVLLFRGDVTSAAAMREAAATARARWGRVDGVIHAAGVAGGGLIAVKTRDAAERVLAAKVRGTLTLERAFADEPLEFFLVCSSLAALAGGVGQADYCGANAFLDAWAVARADRGQPAHAIDWDAWQQVGMAVNTTVPAEWKAGRDKQLALALTPEDGIEVFRRVIDQDYPRIAVCTVGIETRLRPPAAAADDHNGSPRPRHPRPALTIAYTAPTGAFEQRLAALWEQALGVDGIGANDNFFDLGGDSLTALRVVDRLRDEHAIDLSIARFYEAPTIRLMAAQMTPHETH